MRQSHPWCNWTEVVIIIYVSDNYHLLVGYDKCTLPFSNRESTYKETDPWDSKLDFYPNSQLHDFLGIYFQMGDRQCSISGTHGCASDGNLAWIAPKWQQKSAQFS